MYQFEYTRNTTKIWLDIYLANENDIKIKDKIMINLINIIKIGSSDLLFNLELFLKIIFKILFDSNFELKGNNIDIIIKENIKFFYINNYGILKNENNLIEDEILLEIDKSLRFINSLLTYNYNEIQNWSLSWINHIYEISEIKITDNFYKVLNNILNFYCKCENQDMINTIYILIDKLKNKFLFSVNLKNLESNLLLINSILNNFDDLKEEKIKYLLQIQKNFLEIFFSNLNKISIFNIDNLKKLNYFNVFNKIIQNIFRLYKYDYKNLFDLIENISEYLKNNITIYFKKLEDNSIDNTSIIEELLNNLINYLNSENHLVIKLTLKWLEKLIDIIDIYHIFSFKKLYLNILSDDKEILENSIKIISKIIIKNQNYSIINEMFLFLLKSNNEISLILKSIYFALKYLLSNINDLLFLKNILKEINNIKEMEIKKKIIKNLTIIIFFDKCGEFYKNRIKNLDLNNDIDFKIYLKIYKILYNDFISSIYLCLIKRHYSLALYNLIQINKEGINSNDLIHISKFVKILEQPYFTFLRIDMLNKELNNDLLKFFDLILIILPQGEPFKILQTRLKLYIMFNNIDILENDENYKNILLNSKETEKLLMNKLGIKNK